MPDANDVGFREFPYIIAAVLIIVGLFVLSEMGFLPRY